MFIADLSEPKSIHQAALEIKKKYNTLNGLVNVAAVFKKNRLENSSGLEYMFATNHLGTFVLTIDKRYENSNGTFLTLGGKEIKSNEYSKNKDLQEKLWLISEQLVKY